MGKVSQSQMVRGKRSSGMNQCLLSGDDICNYVVSVYDYLPWLASLWLGQQHPLALFYRIGPVSAISSSPPAEASPAPGAFYCSRAADIWIIMHYKPGCLLLNHLQIVYFAHFIGVQYMGAPYSKTEWTKVKQTVHFNLRGQCFRFHLKTAKTELAYLEHCIDTNWYFLSINNCNWPAMTTILWLLYHKPNSIIHSQDLLDKTKANIYALQEESFMSIMTCKGDYCNKYESVKLSTTIMHDVITKFEQLSSEAGGNTYQIIQMCIMPPTSLHSFDRQIKPNDELILILIGGVVHSGSLVAMIQSVG